MAKKKTHKKFVQEVKEKYGNEFTLLDDYKGADIKIKVRHNKCGYEWEITPNNLLKIHSCPICSNKKSVLGINTIWDTDKWMVDLGVSEEDAKRYSYNSNKKIEVKCPDCGKEKKIRISDIFKGKSIGCSCGDGKSYPEKFVMSVLEQIKVNFENEYSPLWIKPKRYDFYIPESKWIIEAHGEQHYEEVFQCYSGKTLIQERINDNLKKESALNNGIKHYITLDCRESNIEWIKNSILNSELANLFDLSKVNWINCAEFANKNIVKEVCDYWNNRKDNETTSDLVRKFEICKSTLVNYLKKGDTLGWCSYNPKEETKKSSNKNGYFLKKKLSKKVEIFKDNKTLGIFESCAELSRQSEKLFEIKLLKEPISSVCRGEKLQYKGFTFKYVEDNKNYLKD